MGSYASDTYTKDGITSKFTEIEEMVDLGHGRMFFGRPAERARWGVQAGLKTRARAPNPLFLISVFCL